MEVLNAEIIVDLKFHNMTLLKRVWMQLHYMHMYVIKAGSSER